MIDPYKILAINLGSTTTKAGVYENKTLSVRETISYTENRDLSFSNQLRIRKKDLLRLISEKGIDINNLDMIVSRGGLMKPTSSGIFRITAQMCEDLLSGEYGRHVSSLGPVIAYEIGKECGAETIVVDPPSTDEFHAIARYSGIPGIRRKSAFHALNQKAAARKAAMALGRAYREVNFIVVHMGGGITIGAHQRGRVVDATHGLNEGPFTPERAGSLPTLDLIDLIFSKGYSRKEVSEMLVSQGGLFAYLGTKDALKIEETIRSGDRQAVSVYRAMAYQIAKEIGAMAVVLKGELDGIILTGGLAQSELLVPRIKEWVSSVGQVMVFPGEDEIAALIDGGLRVLKKEENVKTYPERN